MGRALDGVRVIDLGHGLAGPWCAMFLGDLGAEVIKVEPPEGDDARDVEPFIGKPSKNCSAYFINLNRNKKSIVLDLNTDKGKEVLRDLIKVSDAIVENFSPTTMSELGFGWEQIHEINPRIIYASISSFGHDSLPQYTSWPAYDLVAQAFSGIMSITGVYHGDSSRVGGPVGDFYSAAQAAISTLAALYNRCKTGRGQWHDGAMVDALSYVLENAVVRYTNDREVPTPLGGIHPAITPFQGFKSKDSWIIVPCGNDRLWALLCGKVIEREDLIHDPRFENNALRTQNRDELNAILDPIFEEKTTGEWLDIFEKLGHPVSPINNIKEASEDLNTIYRKMVIEVDQPEAGKVKLINSPIICSETRGEVYAPAPLLGEHSEEVLSRVLGYSQEDINKLKEAKVVCG